MSPRPVEDGGLDAIPLHLQDIDIWQSLRPFHHSVTQSITNTILSLSFSHPPSLDIYYLAFPVRLPRKQTGQF